MIHFNSTSLPHTFFRWIHDPFSSINQFFIIRFNHWTSLPHILLTSMDGIWNTHCAPLNKWTVLVLLLMWSER